MHTENNAGNPEWFAAWNEMSTEQNRRSQLAPGGIRDWWLWQVSRESPDVLIQSLTPTDSQTNKQTTDSQWGVPIYMHLAINVCTDEILMYRIIEMHTYESQLQLILEL